VNVINPRVELPPLTRSLVASPAGSLIDEDQLRDVLQGREHMLVDGVIERRTAVQDK
jgi:hypothetical protein